MNGTAELGEDRKKNPDQGPGWEACRRCRVQTPLREEQAGGSQLPIENLSNNKTANKSKFEFLCCF